MAVDWGVGDHDVMTCAHPMCRQAAAMARADQTGDDRMCEREHPAGLDHQAVAGWLEGPNGIEEIPAADANPRPARPATHRVDIELNNAAHGMVTVDGQHVEHLVMGLTAFASPGRGPRVMLELSAAMRLKSDAAVVELGPETEALLRRLGWTPPAAPQVPVAADRNGVQH